MPIVPLVRLVLAGALSALSTPVHAQIVELRATINAAQEVPANASPASGTAIMLYDVRANTFDLIVSINGMTNTATASHIHEAPAGANGGVVTNLGAESAYTRSGTSLTGNFRNLTYGGDKLKLLQGGAYLNFHSAQFPGGEVRGQLFARPVRLVAKLDVAQEAAAFPALNFSGVNNFGAAVMWYDPVANTISIRHSLFLFSSVFTNSHIHEGAPGASGPARTQLGTSATAGAYNSANGHISGSHDIPFAGDPLLLLTGRNYLNYHSQAFTGGQLRGQIQVSNEVPSARYGNLSIRGVAGAGDQVLIGGLSISGTEPVRTLITAKGPSLTAFGVTGAVANPRLELYDSAGRLIAFNDDVGAIPAGSELSRIPGVPVNPVEAALVVVLPPGNYTAHVSAPSGTGVALLEINDLRSLGEAGIAVSSLPGPTRQAASPLASVAKAALEFCDGLPLATTVAKR
ncbi:MAG: hypothetical protein RL479_2404 [Verrucomicrobiota bacterium]